MPAILMNEWVAIAILVTAAFIHFFVGWKRAGLFLLGRKPKPPQAATPAPADPPDNYTG